MSWKLQLTASHTSKQKVTNETLRETLQIDAEQKKKKKKKE